MDKLPSRVKHYLLDWMDANISEYMTRHPRPINKLSMDQLLDLYRLVVSRDESVLKDLKNGEDVRKNQEG